MAYTLKKQPDGDLSLGNLRGELVVLQPAVSDYVPGGYLIEGIGGATENVGNVGLDKVLFVIPAGDSGAGYGVKWNTTTSKLQVYQDSTNVGQFSEVPASTNLAPYNFQLLVVGL